jgi:hypothetical protein
VLAVVEYAIVCITQPCKGAPNGLGPVGVVNRKSVAYESIALKERVRVLSMMPNLRFRVDYYLLPVRADRTGDCFVGFTWPLNLKERSCREYWQLLWSRVHNHSRIIARRGPAGSGGFTTVDEPPLLR